ncbi:MAG TPA: hypothetical protein VFV52_10890 [Bacilli bacterium]|nr:hypothetical protein [Bacilli bacterium]
MNHTFRFSKAREYAFFHEDVHLLLVDFERDGKQEVFYIADQEEDGTFLLEYPGEMFTEQVQEVVSSIFFVQVQEENREGRYALGAFFTFMRKEYALYYDREQESISELVFFRAENKGTGQYDLHNITDQAEYQELVEHITDRFGHLMSVE